jgi:hypothetical protein
MTKDVDDFSLSEEALENVSDKIPNKARERMKSVLTIKIKMDMHIRKKITINE